MKAKLLIPIIMMILIAGSVIAAADFTTPLSSSEILAKQDLWGKLKWIWYHQGTQSTLPGYNCIQGPVGCQDALYPNQMVTCPSNYNKCLVDIFNIPSGSVCSSLGANAFNTFWYEDNLISGEQMNIPEWHAWSRWDCTLTTGTCSGDYDCPIGKVCSSGSCVTAPTCTDSDGGKNYEIRGSISPAGIFDTCNAISPAYVTEFYCDANSANGYSSENHYCGTGNTCEDGACIPYTASETCSDGIQNQGETGTDCGGPCTACGTTSTKCDDGVTPLNSCSATNKPHYCDANAAWLDNSCGAPYNCGCQENQVCKADGTCSITGQGSESWKGPFIVLYQADVQQQQVNAGGEYKTIVGVTNIGDTTGSVNIEVATYSTDAVKKFGWFPLSFLGSIYTLEGTNFQVPPCQVSEKDFVTAIKVDNLQPGEDRSYSITTKAPTSSAKLNDGTMNWNGEDKDYIVLVGEYPQGECGGYCHKGTYTDVSGAVQNPPICYVQGSSPNAPGYSKDGGYTYYLNKIKIVSKTLVAGTDYHFEIYGESKTCVQKDGPGPKTCQEAGGGVNPATEECCATGGFLGIGTTYARVAKGTCVSASKGTIADASKCLGVTTKCSSASDCKDPGKPICNNGACVSKEEVKCSKPIIFGICAESRTKQEFADASDTEILQSACDEVRNCNPREGYNLSCTDTETVGIKMPIYEKGLTGLITGLGDAISGFSNKNRVCLASKPSGAGDICSSLESLNFIGVDCGGAYVLFGGLLAFVLFIVLISKMGGSGGGSFGAFPPLRKYRHFIIGIILSAALILFSVSKGYISLTIEQQWWLILIAGLILGYAIDAYRNKFPASIRRYI
jgi:hypothetical protein